MTWLTDLRRAVGKATADESDGLITFKPTGTYTAGQLGIYGVIMPEKPDEAIAMSTTIVDEDLETTVRLTFRFRAATELRLDTIGDALDASWRKRPDGIVSGVQIIMSEQTPGANLGQDAGRVLRSANYYLTVHRPHPYSI